MNLECVGGENAASLRYWGKQTQGNDAVAAVSRRNSLNRIPALQAPDSEKAFPSWHYFPVKASVLWSRCMHPLSAACHLPKLEPQGFFQLPWLRNMRYESSHWYPRSMCVAAAANKMCLRGFEENLSLALTMAFHRSRSIPSLVIVGSWLIQIFDRGYV